MQGKWGEKCKGECEGKKYNREIPREHFIGRT